MFANPIGHHEVNRTVGDRYRAIFTKYKSFVEQRIVPDHGVDVYTDDLAGTMPKLEEMPLDSARLFGLSASPCPVVEHDSAIGQKLVQTQQKRKRSVHGIEPERSDSRIKQ